MSNKIILVPISIIICIFLFSSCQPEQQEKQTQESSDNLYYDCLESKIAIDAGTTVLDNKRGQWSVSFDGKLNCGSDPIKGAEVNVKSDLNNTDLTIKTNETGGFSIKLSRLEENPAGKELTVTLMGTKDAKITKSFKVE